MSEIQKPLTETELRQHLGHMAARATVLESDAAYLALNPHDTPVIPPLAAEEIPDNVVPITAAQQKAAS